MSDVKSGKPFSITVNGTYDANITEFAIEESKDGGEFTEVARVPNDPAGVVFQFPDGRTTGSYTFRGVAYAPGGTQYSDNEETLGVLALPGHFTITLQVG